MSIENEIRGQLEQRANELRERLTRIKANRRREAGPIDADFAEQAVDLEHSEVLNGLDNQVRTELVRIQSALDRLDSGDFGECLDCGNEIKEVRLRAVPFAIHCIKCAEKSGAS